MNARSDQNGYQIDWVINYLEVNSQPKMVDGFSRLRISDSELRIDPAGIILSTGQSTEQGLELHSESESYWCTISQRGSELTVRIRRANSSDSIMLVAKRSVSEFEPSYSMSGTNQAALLTNLFGVS